MALHTTQQLLKQEHRLLGLMLASLLTATAIIQEVNLSKSLLIIHFGLFLLWQPVLKQQQTFSLKDLAILLAFLAGFLIWFNLWTATFWMLLLMSLLTGRIFARGLKRASYGLAVVILFMQITLIITPELFNLVVLGTTVSNAVQGSLIALSLLLLLVPSEESKTINVDYIRGFMVVFLTLFLCMGSVLSTYNTDNQYLPSLIITVLIAAAFLFATALLWSPRAGFTGLAQIWEKYLLNIGGPFEQWVSRLATLEANTNISPDGFLQTAIDDLLDRHWIAGVYWKTTNNEMLQGDKSKHLVSYTDPKLRMELYADNPVGPALQLHTKLLLSVLTFYYRARLQEEQLIKQAHLRAIYETGSKLTHDIKNILQSTQMLTQVMADPETPLQDARDMLAKQLPLLTQRLKSTLDKLSTPESSETDFRPLQHWWQDLQTRHAGRYIRFSGQLDSKIDIPADVFDSVIENLLDNARSKRAQDPAMHIDVSISSSEDFVRLRVSDSGKAIPDDIASALFNEVIDSDNGLGIGLYQARQAAIRSGYELELINNVAGDVCFQLSTSTASQQTEDEG